MVRRPRAIALGDAERALELRAAAERRRHLERQAHALRHVAARAAHHDRRAVPDGAHDRVVGAHVDRAVVDEEGVRDLAEPLARVVVVVGDRLVRDVGRGHDERAAEVAEQEMLKRRVGKHHAEVPRERRHRGATWRSVAPAGDHDRPLAARAEALPQRRRARPGCAPRRGSVAISANGFSSRCLRARSAATASSDAASQARW